MVGGPQFGKVTVTVDGTPTTVDLYNASFQLQKVAFSKKGLVKGPHTVVVAPTGTKNAASTATTIALDAIDTD